LVKAELDISKVDMWDTYRFDRHSTKRLAKNTVPNMVMAQQLLLLVKLGQYDAAFPRQVTITTQKHVTRRAKTNNKSQRGLIASPLVQLVRLNMLNALCCFSCNWRGSIDLGG
jgi:hypothetical protein